MNRPRRFSIAAVSFLMSGVLAMAAAGPLPKVDEFLKEMGKLKRHRGLLTFHIDEQQGRLWLEVPAADDPDTGVEVIYVEGLTSGLGSNPVGLDRGQLGDSALVGLRRVGGRVLVEQKNLGFRALSDNLEERRAVREAFASSVLWGGDIVAENSNGTVLVDFTSFVVRDAHNSTTTLDRTGQGSFSLDKSRSALDPAACMAFPDNVEFEALLTLTGGKPGRHIRNTVPHSNAVTLVQHHSFIRLPDDGYKTRRFDPRAGSFAIGFQDYAVPLEEHVDTQWIVRHRLEKKNPKSARSEVKEPIVYYVDRGVPEPVRSALVEGASWWSDAFDAAGFEDAYRIEIMPEGVHPLDVRYNVIEWVHRSTRGWSYGGGVIDPRTGEMIKGHVNLGSLRVRQDRLLFEGLAGTAKTGTGDADDPVQLALARIRQLSAHEVGHTLGFAHNFAASTYEGRASVMDYPAPLVKIDGNNQLDFSESYAVGAGAWDKHAVRYAYSEFAPGADEATELEKIVLEGIDKGYLFISDADARPAGAAHPLSNLWDNGSDPVADFKHTLRVRQIALDGFGVQNILEGRPVSLLEEVIVPVYLHHRYQLDAVVKVLGGIDYVYAVRGDGQPMATLLDPAWQRSALNAALAAIEEDRLDLPEPVLELLMPRPFGHGRNRELLNGQTRPAFDPLGAAATAADMVIKGLLQPERLARVADHHRRDADQPSLQEVLDAVIDKAFHDQKSTPRLGAISRVVRGVVVEDLIALASDTGAVPQVRAQAEATLSRLFSSIAAQTGGDDATRASRAFLAGEIDRFLKRHGPADTTRPEAPSAPPGSPIGQP